LSEAFLELAPQLRRRLARALEAGLLDGSSSAAAIRAGLNSREGTEEASAALAEVGRLGISGRAAAAWLDSLDVASARALSPDLVWSGPKVPGVPARETRRVYEELLGSATRQLWVSTYAFFDGPAAFEALAGRMDEVPELDVVLLLNVQRKRGELASAENVVTRFAERFWRVEWPGGRSPRVFYDPRSLGLESVSGVLHAKAVVADDEAVFITSANLTEAALDRNIELGLLVRDRTIALSVVSHFKGLIEHGLVSALPVL
jgi:phosphatidylserine/phosphatidylglycerophosphate/cardiolipin synthase-like enzyme